MKLSSFKSAVICLFILAGQVFAQPPDKLGNDSSETVFNNARIIVGDGTVIEQGSILVRDGTILGVGPASSLDISDSAIFALGVIRRWYGYARSLAWTSRWSVSPITTH